MAENITGKSTIGKRENLLESGIVISMLLLPLAAFFSPRLMAYVPGVIGIIGVTGGFFLARQRPNIPKPALFWVAAIVALAGISALWSRDLGFAFEKTLRIALVIFPGLLLLSAVMSLEAQRVRRYLWLLPLAVALAATFNIIELYFDMPFHRLVRGLNVQEEIGRAPANRSIFCTVVAFFVCVPVIYQIPAFAGMTPKGVFPHIVMGGMAALLVTMLMLSEGQSSQLCFILAFLSLFLFPYKFKPAWMIFAAIFAVLILTAPWTVQIMFKTVAASVTKGSWLAEAYAPNRLEIWDFVARYALQNPIFGYGVEATRLIEDFDTHKIYHSDSMILHPHNFALQLWMEYGVIGAVFGSVFLGDVLRRMARLPIEAARVALPVFLCFLSVAATGYGMWQGWWLGEMMYALALTALVVRAFQFSTTDEHR